MENGKALLIQAIETIIFCIAVTLLLIQAKQYTNILQTLNHTEQKNSLMYEEQKIYTDNQHEMLVESISYKGLIASLCDTLEYDLEIDGLLISKYEHIPEHIEEYNIKEKRYRKSYAYDTCGNVTRIIYTSVKQDGEM